MRNNLDERLKQLEHVAKETPPEQTLESQEGKAPQLNFVIPTELVELPSRGVFYYEGHPLKNKDVVEIKQMTAKEEDILTNKSFIKKGVVIDKLIESLLLDKSIDVSTLLVGDKNAIMVAARKSAYGANYDVSLTCQQCGNKSNLGINLNNITTIDADEIQLLSDVDPTLVHNRLENGNVLIKLPKTGWFVECRMLTGKDERKLLALLEIKRKTDAAAEITLSEQLTSIVDAINTFTDRVKIIEAIQYMPAYDAKHLRTVYQKLIPNVKIQNLFSCSSCGVEQEVEVPFTQEFFWPK